MARLTFVTHARSAGDAAHPRITDLALGPNGTTLFAVTAAGGDLSAWETGGGLSRIHARTLPGSAGAGPPPEVAPVDLGGKTALIATGTGAPRLHDLQENGGIGSGKARPVGWGAAALADLEAVTLPDGSVTVYGGLVTRAGLAAMRLSESGALLSSTVTPDGPAARLGAVTALAAAEIGGRDFLFAASGGAETGLTALQIGAGGALTPRSVLAPEDGLWVSAPTALARLALGQAEYLVLGAAGSGSLSVVRVGAGGALSVTDHLIDDLDSRFGGVTALATVSHRGRGFVVSGGADDGISVHELLPGGRLVALAHLADSRAAALANVSAIAARAAGDGLDIFVASASEPGLTRLALDLRGGLRRSGGPGDDRVSGGGGDDVLRDGGGSDTLSGGGGTDLFVLDADGRPDTITDFDPERDRLDLSAWAMLRDISQLVMRREGVGVWLEYGAERLLLRGADGRAPDLAALRSADLIGGTHLPVRPAEGHAAPPPQAPLVAPNPVTGTAAARWAETQARAAARAARDAWEEAEAAREAAQDPPGRLPAPSTPSVPEEPPPSVPVPPATPVPPPPADAGAGQGTPTSGKADDPPAAVSDDDVLYGTALGNRLHGGAGADRLYGGDGNDWLYGGTGADRLDGGADDDRLLGGPDDDRLLGRAGKDRLEGQNGNDWLGGGSGDDRLYGGKGHDDLNGGKGRDRLNGGKGRDDLDAGKGSDRLDGGGHDDVLLGGRGDDRLLGRSGRDRLEGQRNDDWLGGGSGNDRLYGGKGRDDLNGGKGHDRLHGGTGRDDLDGGKGRDRLDGGAHDDRLHGGAGADVFVFNGGRDRIDDFSPAQGDRLLLDDGLWRGDLRPDEVIRRFADRRDGGVSLDFGDGDRLWIEDLSRPSALSGLVDIG
ncbi:calcium-binding protein (plasmid) [Limimaricola variabilis]|uniref:calcium-binding protein n=1 Tax=Limimaricola variabilis TaxID=1492771 RepID=UPI002AC8E9E8|nr:calcium-binding protein [Limimaricola variabilis]WPY97051.1 calcium-binding protein [Limimaricola variabilis]